MDLPILFLFCIFLIILALIVFFLNHKLNQIKAPATDKSLLAWLESMQTSLNKTNQSINDSLAQNSTQVVRTLQENTRQLNDRLDRAAQVIQGVGHEVGQMSEIGRSMRELQEFLKSPKMRGNIGEEVLKDLLNQLFPKQSLFLQYEFKSGDKVDAAIKTDAGILPIDSKFPMENFQRMHAKTGKEGEYESYKKEFIRDVRKHISDIAKKYIHPSEGTMDFALMYVPSETVFYEVCTLVELLDYARKHRVYIVSPSTLYAHLQTILLSYEGKKIESHSKEILQLLRSMQLDYEKVEENLSVLGKHLGNATSQFNQVTTNYVKIGSKLNSTKLLEQTTNE